MKSKIKLIFPEKALATANHPAFLPKSKVIIIMVAIIALTLLLANRFIWKPVVKINQMANRNFYATNAFVFVDENETQKLLNEVISTIKPTLSKNNKVTEEEKKDFKTLLQQITVVKEATKENPYYNRGVISTDVQDYIFSLSQPDWESQVYFPTIDTLAQLSAGGIPENMDKDKFNEVLRLMLPSKLTPLQEKTISQILTVAFFPDKAIYYGSMRQESSSETSKKNDFKKLYNQYLKENVDNSSWLNAVVEKPTLNEVNSYIDRIAFVFRGLEILRSMKTLNDLAFNILPGDIKKITKDMTEDKWWETKQIAENTFEQLLNDGVAEVDLDNIEQMLVKYEPDNLTQSQKDLIYLLIKKVVKPNVIIDKEQMKDLKKEALKEVKPVKINYNKGELLVKKGELINNDRLKLLESAGKLNTEIDWTGVSEIFSIVTVIIFLFSVYIYVFEKECFLSLTNLWLICILVISVTCISSLVADSNNQFIPLAVFTSIIAMFMSQRLALVSLFFLLVLYINGYNLDITTILALTLGSFAAIAVMPKVNQRINILKCGIVMALVQVIAYNIGTIAFETAQPSNIIDNGNDILIQSVMWFVSGIAFSMVILAILPLVEESFGLVTYSRLTELGDFNQPLLRELEDKAPGTFQHSLVVSSLTEYAARKLNLDSTFCRVGAYYHDLGKMMKPEYFIENQFNTPNPHDEINDPYKSAKIIIAHASIGVNIAKKHKLPQALIPFITEHHGSSLVSYFYYKAKQQAQEGEKINESEFRYFGPKPQSKETAILMIADSSEAAVRSIKDKTSENIRNKIKDIVSDKINSGQLSSSGLKTDEIATIIDAFTHVMLDFYHKRIEYPSTKKL